MEKYQNKISKTKSKLYYSLIDLLHQKELEDIQINMLCTRANVNRATFYLHFQNIIDLKEELVYSEIEKILNTLDKSFLISNKNDKEYLNKYKELFLNAINVILQNKAYYEIFPKIVNCSDYANIINYIKDNSKCSLRNLRNNCSDIENDYVNIYYLSGIINVIIKWIRDGYKQSPIEISDILIKCINF